MTERRRADGASPLPPHLAWVVQPPEPPRADGVADEDVTWAYVWPAGALLSAELPGLVPLAGASVLDLGCGRGHCGLAALAAGAARVRFADGSPAAIARIAALIAANRLDDRASASVGTWGGAVPGAPFQVIVGGDILYRPDCFRDLLGSISASLAPDGVCLLSDPRLRLESELPSLAADLGLSWTAERRDRGYTLVRVGRSSR